MKNRKGTLCSSVNWKNRCCNICGHRLVLSKQRDSSVNTVQSALERLFKKGLLRREKQGHAYLYFAQIERGDLIAKLIDSVASDFVSKGESSMVAAFSSVSSEMDEAQLDQLEKLIERQRKQLQKGNTRADK
jgi:predicted transcriptional regulator